MFSSLAAILPFMKYGEKLTDPVIIRAAFQSTITCRACASAELYRRYKEAIPEVGIPERLAVVCRDCGYESSERLVNT